MSGAQIVLPKSGVGGGVDDLWKGRTGSLVVSSVGGPIMVGEVKLDSSLLSLPPPPERFFTRRLCLDLIVICMGR
jgi:hypothetical protein